MPAHAPLLLKTLAVMAQHEGPAAFFDFADAGAGLMRTTALRFPGAGPALQSRACGRGLM